MGPVAIASIGLSLVGVVVALVFLRRETRVRTWMDVARLLVTGAVVVAMSLVMGVSTVGWVAAAAAGLGLVVGAAPGGGGRVRLGPKGPMAKRSALGIVGWGLGIVVAQVAANFNRAGIVRLGLALSFLSIGTMVGLLLARSQAVGRARGAVPATAAVLLVAFGGGVLATQIHAPASSAQASLCPPEVGGVALEEATFSDAGTPLFVACEYDSGSDDVSDLVLSATWVPDDSEFDGWSTCGWEEEVLDQRDRRTVSIFGAERQAQASYRIEDVTLSHDAAAVRDATLTLLATVTARSAPCPGTPEAIAREEAEDAAAREPYPDLAPGAVPDGVIRLSGGVIAATLGTPEGSASLSEAAPAGFLGIARNEAVLDVPVEGGSVDGAVILVQRWDDRPLAEALVNALSPDDPGEILPCFYLVGALYDLTGDYDSETGVIDLEILARGLPTRIVSGCEDNEFVDPGAPISADATGILIDGSFEVSIRAEEDGGWFTIDVVMTTDGIPAGDLLLDPPPPEFAGEETLLGGGESLTAFDGDEDRAEPGGGREDRTDATAAGDPADDDEAAAEGEERSALEDLLDDLLGPDVDIDDEDAAVAALVGLLGIGAAAASALLDAGAGAADVADALAGAGGAPVDEYGDPMVVNDGSWEGVPVGHVWWDDGSDPRWIPPDEAADRVATEREAMEDRRSRHDSIVHDQETGAAERFEAMRARAAAREAAVRAAAEQTAIPPVRSREEILAALEAAEREQAAATGGWWGTLLDAFWDGTYRDTMSLPGVAVDAGIAAREALDATYDAVTDPENWRIVGETAAQTGSDVAGLFVGRTEAVDKASDSFGKGAAVARAVGEAIVRDPWGFAKSVTPIEAFEKGLDPDVPLGRRIGSIWAGSLDVMATLGTGGAAKVADTGLDLARAADTVGDAARTVDRVDDALDAGRAVDRLEDASRAADRIDDTADAARAADPSGASRTADAVEETTTPARTATGRRIPTDEEVAARREAFQRLEQRARANVDEFERVVAEGGDARAAALRVQADKRGLQQINERSEEVRAAMNAEMRRIYDRADDAMLREVAERNGFRSGTLREVTDAGTPAGHRVFVDDVGNEIHMLEPTNPSRVPKVGADRDLTVRIRPADPDWTKVHGVNAVDVDHRVVQQVYDDAFFDAAGGDEVFDALGLADEPGKMRSTVFSERMDQVATDTIHAESYRDLGVVLHGPGADLTDAQQVGMAMGYKGDHWFERADLVDDTLTREDFMAEGMRQLTKQADNQALRRLDAINSQRAVAGLSEATMPPKLRRAVDIMRQVNPKPGSGLTQISPAEAEHLLATTLDTDPTTVARDLGGFVEALDTLASRNGAFDAFRSTARIIADRRP
ncbi:MAG: hypothetical protein R3290_01760 [Acidimicrobiia bacterium]|nr:hypothetical protein [Acidimicrobiia bacterium]